jgi:hypothetical protein
VEKETHLYNKKIVLFVCAASLLEPVPDGNNLGNYFLPEQSQELVPLNSLSMRSFGNKYNVAGVANLGLKMGRIQPLRCLHCIIKYCVRFYITSFSKLVSASLFQQASTWLTCRSQLSALLTLEGDRLVRDSRL